MASLRFAILKTVKQGRDEQIALEYDETQILDRLQARVRENLAKTERVAKRKWNKTEVATAIDLAFSGLVAEFKQQSVKIVP